MSGIFLPSMIEVEFGDYYKRCAELLSKNGFNSFHVDFGDKLMIGRQLECWDKVHFLKGLGSKVKLTAHIMSMSGSHRLSVEKIAKRCIEEGFEIIYIHARSFDSFGELLKFKETFFRNDHDVFGIVSELDNQKNQELIEFVKENSIHNILQMGVPIGRGGQKFGWPAIDRINDFLKACSRSTRFELDGGLTFDVLKKLNNKNSIDRFAGWSIIADQKPSVVSSKAFEVMELI
tara:strand:+ start:3024 stop:3722 length:699 start_codon:yes stop_codon:yes gene_type:complete